MNNKQILALYGLKWNPFHPDVPTEALWSPPAYETLCVRVDQLVMRAGFALICGEPGQGKSKLLQLLAHRFTAMGEVVVGVMERPQSSLSDFYREMGALFGVNLSPANRYGGFQALRQRWQEHTKASLIKPLLIFDEAQEMMTACLNEIRLLLSAQFDSTSLMTTLLCGDERLPERFRSHALLSLGSRIQVRHPLQPYGRDELLDYLDHALSHAGASHLMTQSLRETLVDHAGGNLRVLTMMAAQVLDEGARKELAQLDERLFLELFSHNPSASRKRRRQPLNKEI